MAGYLCHSSALTNWRSNPDFSLENSSPSASQRARLVRDFASHVPLLAPGAIALLSAHGFDVDDLHLLAPSLSSRRKPYGATCHVWSGPMPENPFVALTPEVWCSSPSFTFVQMAQQLSLTELVLLGYELCGSYALVKRPLARDDGSTSAFDDVYAYADACTYDDACAYDSPGFFEMPNRTTAEQLVEASRQIGRERGAKIARRASALVANGAASPMETALSMLLSMPTHLGGYGFDLPCMNMRVDLGADARLMTSHRFFVCDLCWPSVHVALEYDSNAFHAGTAQIAHDSIRRNALSYKGFEVISVTWAQLASPVETDRIARLLARLMGRRLRIEANDWRRRRDELRRLVLPR